MYVNLDAEVSTKVISLKRDTERRKLFDKNNYKKLPKYEFHDAVDGRKLSAAKYHSLVCKLKGRAQRRQAISPSELGCFLSHRAALHLFLTENSSPFLMVLEDDVELISKLRLETIRINPTAVNILGGQEGLKRSFVWNTLMDNGFMFKVPGIVGHTIYRTSSYLISREVAKKMHKLMTEYTFLADDWGYIASQISIGGYFMQKLFSHPLDLTASNIEHERKLL